MHFVHQRVAVAMADFNEIKAVLTSVSPALVVQSLLAAAASSHEKAKWITKLLAPLFRSADMGCEILENKHPESENTELSSQQLELIPQLRRSPLQRKRRRAALIKVRSRDDTQIFRRSKADKKSKLRRYSSGEANQILRIRGKKTGTLLEIMEEPQLSVGFRAYLASKYCEENVDFDKEVERFKKALCSGFPRAEVLQLAQHIFDSYIADDSPYQVNISGTLRVELEKKFANVDENFLSEDLFNRSQFEVRSLLATQWLPSFKEDQCFVDW